jgi:hypothetical protein
LYEWLTANGYPKEVRESYGDYFYIRQWLTDEEELNVKRNQDE